MCVLKSLVHKSVLIIVVAVNTAGCHHNSSQDDSLEACCPLSFLPCLFSL